MIEFRNLTHHAGDRLVLDQVNLCVRPGETLTWLDPSGVSCAVITRLMLGLERPWAGRVLVDGVNPVRDPVKVRRRLVHIPRDVNLYPRLTGLENLAYLVAVAGATPDLSLLRDQLQSVGLDRASQDRLAAGYSREMRQRVLVALAKAKGVLSVLWEFPASGDEEPFNPGHEAFQCLIGAPIAVLYLVGGEARAELNGVPSRWVRGARFTRWECGATALVEANGNTPMDEVVP